MLQYKLANSSWLLNEIDLFLIMISTSLVIEKFGAMGDKTGWTYLRITSDMIEKIKPNNKKIFRVKGKVDNVELKRHAIMPIGDGDFLLPLKKSIMLQIKKPIGEKVSVNIAADNSDIVYDEDFMACLDNEKTAKEVYFSFTDGHRNYFNNYIQQAKSDATKTKRIVKAIRCLEMGMNFPEMLKDKTIELQ
jgi:hypothetical protein